MSRRSAAVLAQVKFEESDVYAAVAGARIFRAILGRRRIEQRVTLV
jgi:hypothetical protein